MGTGKKLSRRYRGVDDRALAVVLIGSASGLASIRGIFHDMRAIVVASGALLPGKFVLIAG